MLTACALACPALAAEAPSPEATPSVLYPVEVLEYTEGDRAEPRISKTYELSPMDDPALIPTGDFERSGCLYTLLDIVKEDQTETDSKYYTETVTLDSKSKDMEEIMPLLAATCEAVTEDGYTGLLTLDTASIQVEASGYATSTRNVSATRSYPNLSEADVSLVPKSIEDSGRTLTLADVQWQEAGGFYNAAATYTGTASSKYATGYTAKNGAAYTREEFDGKLDIVRASDGSIRQIWNLWDGLANIENVTESGYRIALYLPEQVGGKNSSTGLYSVTGDPFKTFTITGDAAAGRLSVTEQTAGRAPYTTRYWQGADGAWNMAQGEGEDAIFTLKKSRSFRPARGNSSPPSSGGKRRSHLPRL